MENGHHRVAFSCCRGLDMSRLRVAFVCVHNSCRSQMAEAIGRLKMGDHLECHSAGTALKDRINPDAVRLIRARYGVDMEQVQRPKLLADLPPVDVVVTMGCNVDCPHLPCRHREDWGLPDPTGQGDEAFHAVIDAIEDKLRLLVEHVCSMNAG